MKKLSVLVALILCVTIGGVYATWNYAQGNVTGPTKYFDAGTIITDKVVSTAKGTITIDTSHVTVTIDDANNDFNGEMTLGGYITVTFTPNVGADETVANNGIAMQYALGTTTGYNFRGTPIFTVDSTVQTLGTGKSFTIQAADLPSITLNPLHLPTAEDYDEFKDALHSGAISITVSEAPVAP